MVSTAIHGASAAVACKLFFVLLACTLVLPDMVLLLCNAVAVLVLCGSSVVFAIDLLAIGD
jgi:hypothetical protein